MGGEHPVLNVGWSGGEGGRGTGRAEGGGDIERTVGAFEHAHSSVVTEWSGGCGEVGEVVVVDWTGACVRACVARWR